jgi:VanZ family protein
MHQPPVGSSSLIRLRPEERRIRPWLQVALRIGFCIGVAAVIVASLLPADYVPVIMNDKVEHLLAYALLSWLGTWSFQTRRTMALLALSLCALAIVLEIGQRFSPGRSTEVADAVVSCLAACSAPAFRFLISVRLP